MDYGTPDRVFDPMHAEFGFTLDAAASADNAKLPRYYTEEQDGLTQSWAGERVWCNPPYSHGTTKLWVAKGRREAENGAQVVVLLVPAATATHWWHDHTPFAEVRFIRGKIQFVGQPYRAHFASAFLIFRPSHFFR